MKDAAEEAEVQEKIAIDVYQWLREVCSTPTAPPALTIRDITPRS